MRLLLIRKSELNEMQIARLTARVGAPEHELDHGPNEIWLNANYFEYLWGVQEIETGMLIGILYAQGPLDCVDVAWWLDSKYRKRGYGSEAIDLLASELKQSGVTNIKRILVDTYAGQYHDASCALARRIYAHWDK